MQENVYQNICLRLKEISLVVMVILIFIKSSPLILSSTDLTTMSEKGTYNLYRALDHELYIICDCPREFSSVGRDNE